ncbi:hypothetical protein C8T65DRAFT_662786 [Cerioporus squamosus]|nr:hypothetical protein C8T65DRAFT_662786 [Cerioporus squamosus]
MVFSHVLPLFALPLLAVATAIQSRAPVASCCASTGTTSDPAIATVLRLIGIDASSISGLVGLDCSPIIILGAGSSSCDGTTVTCTDNSNALVAIGCVPITL